MAQNWGKNLVTSPVWRLCSCDVWSPFCEFQEHASHRSYSVGRIFNRTGFSVEPCENYPLFYVLSSCYPSMPFPQMRAARAMLTPYNLFCWMVTHLPLKSHLQVLTDEILLVLGCRSKVDFQLPSEGPGVVWAKADPRKLTFWVGSDRTYVLTNLSEIACLLTQVAVISITMKL